MNSKYISFEIEEIWLDRKSILDQWYEQSRSFTACLIIGPPYCGKYFFADHIHKLIGKEHSVKNISSKASSKKWNVFREDLGSSISIMINLFDYVGIVNKNQFYYCLRNDILGRLEIELGFESGQVFSDFYNAYSYSSESTYGFLRALSNLFGQKATTYNGVITIILCGIHHIEPQIRESLFEQLRAFLDTAPGSKELRRYRVILTSREDLYHLSKDVNSHTSPINCLRRVIMFDLPKSEFNTLLDLLESRLNLFVENRDYLFNTTKGDIYLIKVIISKCQSILFKSSDIIYRKKINISNDLIDQMIESIINLSTDDSLPNFNTLVNFIKSHDDVRNVLSELNSGKQSVGMIDSTGAYTILESCGAVRKVTKNKKYCYEFRNELYRRFVRKYFIEEQSLAEKLLADVTGSSDLSFSSTLASTIRHELGGSINLISTAIDQHVGRDRNTDKLKGFYGDVFIACKRLGLLRAFLDDLAMKSSTVKTVRINDYLSETIPIFRNHLKSHQISLKLNFPKQNKKARLNTAALRIALILLLINSRDAIQPKGRGTVKIGVRYINRGGVVISISDNGIGMDRKTKKNAFSSGYTTKKSGQGIGLTLCQTAVMDMNGEIEIISSKRKGTTVLIKLPKGILIEN